MDYQKILDRIYEEVNPIIGQGKVADYIPALAQVDASKFGMALVTANGDKYVVGDAQEAFSIQSISKVFSLAIAMKQLGDDLWLRVGREPSGNRFDSLVQLEFEHGIPRNPFINAGAITVTDAIFNGLENTKTELIDFIRSICGNKTVDFDQQIAESERETGHRNSAVASFLKSYDNLNNDVQQVLEAYFYQCSVKMSCLDLAHSFLLFANQGYSNAAKMHVLTPRQAKWINSLMLTCGLYNAVGDFAYRVGLPGKSGVGGGIVAIDPGEYSVAVWSPALNSAGNSLAGTRALELLTTYTGRSVF
ncbi:MAG: glutaminase [Bacteroidales bacterium]|nr:glutaminase [Bacteroidales bacterium]